MDLTASRSKNHLRKSSAVNQITRLTSVQMHFIHYKTVGELDELENVIRCHAKKCWQFLTSLVRFSCLSNRLDRLSGIGPSNSLFSFAFDPITLRHTSQASKEITLMFTVTQFNPKARMPHNASLEWDVIWEYHEAIVRIYVNPRFREWNRLLNTPPTKKRLFKKHVTSRAAIVGLDSCWCVWMLEN